MIIEGFEQIKKLKANETGFPSIHLRRKIISFNASAIRLLELKDKNRVKIFVNLNNTSLAFFFYNSEDNEDYILSKSLTSLHSISSKAVYKMTPFITENSLFKNYEIKKEIMNGNIIGIVRFNEFKVGDIKHEK